MLHRILTAGLPAFFILFLLTAGGGPALAQDPEVATVDWAEWSDETFEDAQKYGTLVLLNIAPDWSHQTTWMDLKTYNVQPIYSLINQEMIPIRVSPDARPDIDTRYQAMSAAMFGVSGWPLTAILLPTGEPVSAGTVIKPGQSNLQVGMEEFLRTQIDLFDEDSAELAGNDAGKNTAEFRGKVEGVVERLRHYQEDTSLGEPLDERRLAAMADTLSARFDPKHGGFIKGPQSAVKMLNGGAIRLALALGRQQGNPEFQKMATLTLDEMAEGGIHDRVMGGFHHYTIDRQWRVPRFEKLSVVNADALSAYVEGYQATGDERYREVALGTMEFLVDKMLTGEGGFAAAQAADYGAPLGTGNVPVPTTEGEVRRTIFQIDEGFYYTWAPSELERYLSERERAVFSSYYGIDEQGDVEELPGKNVLSVVRPLQEAAEEADVSLDQAEKYLASALEKLKREREGHPRPPVDENLYANYNGLTAAAVLRAARILGIETAEQHALDVIDDMAARVIVEDKGAKRSPTTEDPELRLLTDQVGLAYGLVAAYEATGDTRYLHQARDLMDWTWDFLRDAKNGGLWDRLPQATDAALLDLPWKPVQDVRYPSGNALAAWVYDRLYNLTKDEEQKKRAEEILTALAPRAVKMGPDASWFGLAMTQHLSAPTFVLVMGDRDDKEVQAMARIALEEYDPNRIVMILGPEQEEARELAGGYPRRGDVTAYVCNDVSCSRPVSRASDLERAIQDFTAAAAEKNKRSPLERISNF